MSMQGQTSGRSRRRLGLGVIGVVAALSGVACGASSPASTPQTAASDAVVVASFDFSENLILAEIYAQALRRDGIPVELLANVGTREVVEPALEQGHIDLVIDYLGSALEAMDPGNPAAHSSTGQARTELSRMMAAHDIVVMDPARAQDQNGFAVTRATARSLPATTLSALAPVAPSMVFGAPPECADREYCLQGLESVYGLHFGQVTAIDTRAATATALQSGEIDIGLLETTDANLADGRFVLLADDRGLQPHENVVPLVRQDAVDRYGQALTQAVAAVTSRLTTAVLIELNRRVEIDGQAPATVAKDWLG